MAETDCIWHLEAWNMEEQCLLAPSVIQPLIYTQLRGQYDLGNSPAGASPQVTPNYSKLTVEDN